MEKPSESLILVKKESWRHAANKCVLLTDITEETLIKFAFVVVFKVGGNPVYIFFDVVMTKYDYDYQ